ncbi:MAG: ketoacyl-ACP synthase III [Ignavibacteriaceae bacterium]|nr:ketoacyl-ACP synthase III [Ignavibacteriaceae bacterium]
MAVISVNKGVFLESAYIKAISYYLPENILSNDKLSEQFPEWSVEKISAKIGIASRRVVVGDECSSDLAYNASIKLLVDNDISPDEIGFVLLCTQSPDYFLPTTACLLQERLGIPTSAGALDFNLGCSGFVYGLSLAKGLILAGNIKNVLLIMAETYSKFIHREDKSLRSIFGDAASACLVSACEQDLIGPFVFGTDGRGAKNLIVEYGGMRNRNMFDAKDEVNPETGAISNKAFLYMNGPEIFNFSTKEVPKSVENLLKKANISTVDVDVFIFHQANQYMLEHLRKKMKIPTEKFYIFMENCGNTVSSTIPIALSEAIKDGTIKEGSKVCLVGFGVGYSWGACLVQF